MSYVFSVVQLPEIKVVGIHTETDMKRAGEDCPALWHAFGPRICGELSSCAALSKGGASYGVSKMIDEQRFSYWAAVGVDSVQRLPEGMDTMSLAAGSYVKCSVPNLEKLGDALTKMYSEWPQTQNEYALDMNGICFELYPENWQMTDALEVYAALLKK